MRSTLFILGFTLFFFPACSTTNDSFDGSGRNEVVSDHSVVPVKYETPKQKAVRLAEVHIARNGYTKAKADRDNVSFETVEFSGNIDENLESRHDTLNPRAFGVIYGGKLGDDNGWTIVFEYSEKMKVEHTKRSKNFSNNAPIGRAVTMNENFEFLSVEHKDVLLNKVDYELN